jgi:hypothetical protein
MKQDGVACVVPKERSYLKNGENEKLTPRVIKRNMQE